MTREITKHHAQEREVAHQIPRVLSIAGTDPTGGAGIHADLKSIAAAGGYGMAAVTALVAQNTQGVLEGGAAIHYPPVEFLRLQLDAVSSDVEIDAIKIGMLGTAEIARTVIDWLDSLSKLPPVVWDPVMVATSGHRLLDDAAVEAVLGLARYARLATPNLAELAILCGTPQRTDIDEAVADAAHFATQHGCAIVVKGGHAQGDRADNVLVEPGAAEYPRVSSPRIDTPHTHGTGCSLSSALATRLGAGEDAFTALEWSTRWLHGAIAHADELHVGRGRGPVDHFHHLRS